METKPKKQRNRKRIVRLIVYGVLAVAVFAILIHYRGVRMIVTSELGAKITASTFTAREATFDAYNEKLTRGWHVRMLRIGGLPTPVLIRVVDTAAPTADPVPQTVSLGQRPGPDAFVAHIKDADVVRVSFETVPDFDSEWSETIKILLEDGAGNRSTVSVPVSVRATVESLTLEAGSDLPSADRFLLQYVEAELVDPLDPSVMHHVGTYPIGFRTAAGVAVQSQLIVRDTVAPRGDRTLLHLLPEETAKPEDFVENAFDETSVAYSYVTEPDYQSREVQTVVVRMMDEGGNTFDVESSLLISGIRPKIVEARNTALTPDDFDNTDGQLIETELFIPDTPGTYAVNVTVNGVPETMAITVVDTTPPVLHETSLAGKTLYTYHDYYPEDFFEAEDYSPVSFMFLKEPDQKKAGRQQITVVARDAAGNESTASRSVYLRKDHKAPNIYGAIDRICYVGEPIAYLTDVFAVDDEDGPVEVTVESNVNTQKTGSYRVIFRAKDLSGNTTKSVCTYKLIRRTVTEEELHTVMQQVMEEITTPDMVNAEKLRAIFDYVQQRIVYTNGSNKNYTDWRKAAYDGYMQGVGDCYNIYALTRALLDETDIQYLSVERLKTGSWRTRHYWVIVNLGTGWYCLDPTRTPRHRVECFMWTREKCSYYNGYWNFKQNKYPPMARTPFDYDAVVQMERDGLLP